MVAAGKAAHGMASAVLSLQGTRVRETVIARGAHPVPDERSVEAGLRALRLAEASRSSGDCLVVLLSGGASAMLAVPAEGVMLGDKAAMTRRLLASGLAIADVNAVRKHMSAIKGGHLAAAAGRSITYAISDVHAPVEDDPAVIGSGPTVADASTFADAERALRQAGLLDSIPTAVRHHLWRGMRGDAAETIKPGDARLGDAGFVLTGSRRDAMDGACAAAASLGYTVERIEPPTLGEASSAAEQFVERVQRRDSRTGGPLCVVASGETTVTLPSDGAGIGGRNQEFALAASRRLAGLGSCLLASVGTDGVDGPTDAAGAFADSTTIARAHGMGLDSRVALQAHDSYPFFQRLGDLIVTGPTGTNVGDLQILILGQGAGG